MRKATSHVSLLFSICNEGQKVCWYTYLQVQLAPGFSIEKSKIKATYQTHSSHQRLNNSLQPLVNTGLKWMNFYTKAYELIS